MRVSILTLVLLFVSSCGGGGGGGGSTTPPPPPPVDADPGGLWFGQLSYADQTFEELAGLTTSDGRFTLVSLDTFGPDTFGQYIGTVTIDGTTVTGSGSAFAPPGSTWDNGLSILDVNLSATIDERTAMSGSLETSDGEIINFELEYDTEYDRASSLPLLQGVWYVYDDVLNPTLTLTIESDGTFAGQNAEGCLSLGQVSIIDASHNIYGWDVTISDCIVAGSYTGMAVLFDIETDDPDNSQNNAVLASISNDQRALLLPLER